VAFLTLFSSLENHISTLESSRATLKTVDSFGGAFLYLSIFSLLYCYFPTLNISLNKKGNRENFTYNP
jgi:hypothetical protein